MSSGRAAGSAGTAGTGTGTVPALVPALRVDSAPGALGRGTSSAGEGKVLGALPGPASSGGAAPGGPERARCLQIR